MSAPIAPKHSSVPKVWVLESEYTGEINGRLGVAERLELPFELLSHARAKAWLDDPAEVKRRPELCLSGTGEDTVDLCLDLKLVRPELSNIFIASILPDQLSPRLQEYDLIAAPPHPELRGAQVLTIHGVPHRLTHERLAAARERWEPRLHSESTPLVGLLVGGNTRYCQGFTPDYAERLGQRILDWATARGSSVILTNSRRTPPESLAALRRVIHPIECAFFDWRDEPDAYFGLLACGDRFVVTGDSLSMACEAAFTGKPVAVTLDEEATEIYHRETLTALIRAGYLELLGPDGTTNERRHDSTLDVAEEIAARIRTQLFGKVAPEAPTNKKEARA